MRAAIALCFLMACETAPPAEPPPVAPPPPPPPTAPPPPDVEQTEAPKKETSEVEAAHVDPHGKPFDEAMKRALEASSRNDARAAEAGYREALRLRPNDIAALAGLAETLFSQNQQPEAIATIERAWAAAPDNPQVRWTFGVIMLANKKRTKEAVAAWEALAKDTPALAERLGVPARLAAIKKYSVPKAGGLHGQKSKAKAPH